MTFTKTEIRNILMEKMGLTKRDAKEFLEAFFEEIKKELVSGKSVKISNFANFDLRHKSTRPGRNPKTGESVAISARKVIRFRVSSKLKEEISGLIEEEKNTSNAINSKRLDTKTIELIE